MKLIKQLRDQRQRRHEGFDKIFYVNLRRALNQHNLVLISLYIFRVKHNETY